MQSGISVTLRTIHEARVKFNFTHDELLSLLYRSCHTRTDGTLGFLNPVHVSTLCNGSSRICPQPLLRVACAAKHLLSEKLVWLYHSGERTYGDFVGMWGT